MAIIPENTVLTGTSVDVLNAIRNSATQNYKDFVPVATSDAACIKDIGAVIMQYPALQNEFINTLMNRIGRVILTSKTYQNPWAMFKKGILEFGETVEEIFVAIAEPHQFDPDSAETELFKRDMPDVRTAFHIMNFQKFYEKTISQQQLKMAFLTIQGVTDLIAKIIDSMYTAANYDELLTMKYLLAKHILAGHMYPVTIPAVSSDNAKAIVTSVKEISNTFEFMSKDYNLAGVQTFSLKNDQYILENSKFNAVVDVNVLAAAFNLDKAEFAGHVVLIDGFGNLDNTRLAKLFENNSNYTELTTEQLAALDSIPAVILDKDWFMVYDNEISTDNVYNAKGKYWNYFYHVWKTFSISPFANNALFIPATPSVTSVTVSPSTATVEAGAKLSLTAAVVVANFAPQSVNWTISGNAKTTTFIDKSGNLTIGEDETATTVTVTATSTYDATKSGTATITVG
jgi:hypothetical protein